MKKVSAEHKFSELGNIQMTCEAHARKPDERWERSELSWFKGKFVKRRFAGIAHDNETRYEQMWVKVTGHTKNVLTGILANQPFFKMDICLGDEVTVHRKEITQVLDADGRTELQP